MPGFPADSSLTSLLAGRRRPLTVLGLALLTAAAILSGLSLRSEGGATLHARLVFAEFGPSADRIYIADADDPSTRSLVATVEHVAGWGINPAWEASTAMVAYTVLPAEGEARRDAPAELWVLNAITGEHQRLAHDADLLAAPVLAADGRTVTYRRSAATGTQTLLTVDLATGAATEVVTTDAGFGVYPVSVEADGAILYVGLSTAGTDLYRGRPGTEPEALFHLSDYVARDWRLAPGGGRLAYLAPAFEAERVVNQLQVATLDGQAVAAPPLTGEQFGPVWRPDGQAVTVGQEAYPAGQAAAVTLSIDGGDTDPLPAPSQGFDAPLSWSPDGRYLAARSFDGVSAYAPGNEGMVVIAEDGARRAVTGSRELIFLGWVLSG